MVQVRGDEVDEFDENVYLLLRSVSGAGGPVIGDGDGIGRIVDDDDLPARPDTEPPDFIGVADLNVTIPDRQSSVIVSWNIRAEDEIDGIVDHVCSPPPKSDFAAGETVVSCVAADAAGNEANASFTVDVRRSSDQRLTDSGGDETERVRPGELVTVRAAGFLPSSQVLAELRSDPVVLALLVTDESGALIAELEIPPDAEPGEHTLSLLGASPTGGVRQALFPIDVIDPECTIVGTRGDDRLRGTSGDDVICGLGGDDHISGLGGNDVLIGGLGNDRLFGGNGVDLLRGNQGNDVLHGGRGTDQLDGGTGNDNLRGGPGNDRLDGGPGDDILRGGQGDDVLWGGPGDDDARGGAGNDVVTP